MKRALEWLVRTLGLGPLVSPIYETRQQGGWPLVRRNLRYWLGGAPDRLPIPPIRLIHDISGSYDLLWFFEGGRLGAETLRQTLARNEKPIEEFRSILDFGCGCGRVLRHWHALENAQVHGTECKAELGDWCARKLPFASFATNRLDPPLEYGDGQFDLIYALSVFTHLSEPLGQAWIAELARLLQPGGHLLITTHGDQYLDQLAPEEQELYQSGQFVVRDGSVAGSNMCMAYHPETYVRGCLAGDFEVLDFAPKAAAGNPYQDVWLLRKPFEIGR